MTEHVLCVPTGLFHEIGRFDGFTAEVRPYLQVMLEPSNLSYQPRDRVEEDPSFKQLIPYCVFRHAGEIFHYTRGGAGGETRLHAKMSVGIGGHISREDGDAGEVAYDAGMRREIEEEVDLSAQYQQRLVGLINDDTNPVGAVHFGLVHLFELDTPQVRPREESILQTGFAPPSQLASKADQFETWSQIVLSAFERGEIG